MYGLYFLLVHFYIPHYTSCTFYFALYMLNTTQCILHSILSSHTIHYMPYSVGCRVYSVQCTGYSCASETFIPTFFSLHSTCYTQLHAFYIVPYSRTLHTIDHVQYVNTLNTYTRCPVCCTCLLNSVLMVYTFYYALCMLHKALRITHCVLVLTHYAL